MSKAATSTEHQPTNNRDEIVMARKQYITMVDDLTGNELGEGEHQTITYSVDGTTYEVDLSHENARIMRDELGKYLAVSRTVNLGHTRRTSKPRAEVDRDRSKQIRAWAIHKGLMSDTARGRIKGDIVKMWEDRSPVEKVQDDAEMRGQTFIGEDEAKPKRRARSSAPAAEFSAQPEDNSPAELVDA